MESVNYAKMSLAEFFKRMPVGQILACALAILGIGFAAGSGYNHYKHAKHEESKTQRDNPTASTRAPQSTPPILDQFSINRGTLSSTQQECIDDARKAFESLGASPRILFASSVRSEFAAYQLRAYCEVDCTTGAQTIVICNSTQGEVSKTLSASIWHRVSHAN